MSTVPDDIIEELQRFDEGFVPSENIPPGAESLPDGDYNFEILEASLKRTPKDKKLILVLSLRVLGGQMDGTEVGRTSSFKNQQNADILGGDLVALGLDADKWNAAHDRTFSAELIAALPALPGIRFRGQKLLKDGYHNIRIRYAIKDGAPLPACRPLAPMPAVAAGYAAPNNGPTGSYGQASGQTEDGSDIPF